MVDPQNYRWQYLFFRGLTIAVVLCVYLLIKDRNRFIHDFKNIGISGVIGAFGLLCAFVGFIWSVTLTTVANALFLFATIPFLGAFLGILILKEKLRPVTWVAMSMSFIGIGVMVVEGLEAGNFLGIATGFASACGFATFSVTLRFRKETPQFTTVALAGILCTIITACILYFQNNSIIMPVWNILMSMTHGTLVGIGLILFSSGAKYFPAAELNLLTLLEVVCGVIWVYLPVFGIHEVPSLLTVIGGCIVLSAILLNSLGIKPGPVVMKV